MEIDDNFYLILRLNARRYEWLKSHNLNGIQLNPDEAYLSICDRHGEGIRNVDITDLDGTIDRMIENFGFGSENLNGDKI